MRNPAFRLLDPRGFCRSNSGAEALGAVVIEGSYEFPSRGPGVRDRNPLVILPSAPATRTVKPTRLEKDSTNR
jgi:hypothetical protein